MPAPRQYAVARQPIGTRGSSENFLYSFSSNVSALRNRGMGAGEYGVDADVASSLELVAAAGPSVRVMLCVAPIVASIEAWHSKTVRC
mmetsp:Transcript_34047/g.74657  ORF Transcript_34047/g.74657 Transcript_34047/m.74657 type:complete len:88 (-) Transcript_34047:69-332(-)